MTQHHTQSLRFERQQSRVMREAEWLEREKPLKPAWIWFAWYAVFMIGLVTLWLWPR